jgi:peptide/nickel transport system permease protein
VTSLRVGLALLCLLAASAVAAGLLAPGDPLRLAGQALQPPSRAHPFGTDDLGRDVFAGVVHGGRISLAVGFLVALTSAAIGGTVGGVAGFAGGWADDALMRLTELVQVLPRFFLAIVVAALFGGSVWLIAVLLGVTFWPTTARLVRAQVLSLREREFVLAARALGVAEARILWRHVMPHAAPILLVSAALQVGAAILVEAGLSFLGVGDPSTVRWGAMLATTQGFLRAAWWTSVFPGLAILLTIVGTNVLADGLRDRLDPARRGGAPLAEVVVGPEDRDEARHPADLAAGQLRSRRRGPDITTPGTK